MSESAARVAVIYAVTLTVADIADRLSLSPT
jgi:hypothetical protein